jgi:hypothetical protein
MDFRRRRNLIQGSLLSGSVSNGANSGREAHPRENVRQCNISLTLIAERPQADEIAARETTARAFPRKVEAL